MCRSMVKNITHKIWLTFFCAFVTFWSFSAGAYGGEQAEAEGELESPAPMKLEELLTAKPATKPAATQPGESTQQAQPVKPWSIADENIDIRLLQDHVVPVTPPKGATLRRSVKSQNLPLPQENTAVADRKGTIKLDSESGWMVMTFENKPGQQWVIPRRLLQCQLLEKVEDILAQNPNTRFEVIGETTVFENNAYLMLTRVAVIDSPPAPPPAPDKTAPKPLVAIEDGKHKTAEPPKAADRQENAEKTPRTTSELITAMLKDKPRTALRVEPASARSVAENTESVAPAGKEPLNPGRKSIVIDRLVRFVQKDHWWEIHFESDNTLREPPMRVLPNSLLTRAVYLNNQLGRGALKLRVSGEVTLYKGRRYILIRKLLVERDLDQF